MRKKLKTEVAPDFRGLLVKPQNLAGDFNINTSKDSIVRDTLRIQYGMYVFLISITYTVI